MSTKITLEELIAKLPDQLKPWAGEYGEAFINMSADELKSWMELMVKGDVYAAYKAVLEKMPNAELLNEWTALNASWQSANEANADKLALQRAALTGFLRILLSIALATVGL